ncbi:hypothetical protein [Saccharothrix sp. HUAS TT1]|uniref:hypothetical protein n=1 Tax=unclassified Saccharothrix TaxID=2593673 RepID=UPI00345BAB98
MEFPDTSQGARPRMNEVMRLVAARGGFVGTTAGPVREVFDASPVDMARELRGHNLLMIPGDVSHVSDDAPVVLCSGGRSVAVLLAQIGRGDDPAPTMRLLLDRVVNRTPKPWE